MKTFYCYLPALVFLVGCVSTQPKTLRYSDYVDELRVGKTTKTEVLAALGEPTKSAAGSRGGTVLTWIKHVAETREATGAQAEPWRDPRSNNFSYVVQRPVTLAIQFNDNDVVSKYQLLEP